MEGFFIAIQSGDQAEIERYVQADPNWWSARAGGISPVLTAVYYGHPEIASYLIEQGAPLDLFEAAATGQGARVAVILDEHPEQVNAYAADGFTPLGLAAFFGHEEIVRALLSRGAAVNQPSKNGVGAYPLHSAAASRQLAICERLIAAGAEINAREEGGFTPLQIAADNGQIELVRLLLEHGADLSLRSDNGKTALDQAQEKGYTEIVNTLQPSFPGRKSD